MRYCTFHVDEQKTRRISSIVAPKPMRPSLTLSAPAGGFRPGPGSGSDTKKSSFNWDSEGRRVGRGSS